MSQPYDPNLFPIPLTPNPELYPEPGASPDFLPFPEHQPSPNLYPEPAPNFDPGMFPYPSQEPSGDR
jgi:hypothetical protein